MGVGHILDINRTSVVVTEEIATTLTMNHPGIEQENSPSPPAGKAGKLRQELETCVNGKALAAAPFC